MSEPLPGTVSPDLDDELAEESIALARGWLAVADTVPTDAAGRRLAGVLRDPHGLEFTVGFVDGVIRPEDTRVAANALRELAPKVPGFLPLPMRAAVRLGGLMAPAVPGVVVPIARAVLRRMVAHLIIDASDRRLGRAIARLRGEGIRLNLNLLGEAVLGEREAQRRLDGTRRLLARDDVDYVSIKVSSTTAPHNPWDFEGTVETVVERLAPLFEIAARATSGKFINLDMEEFHDLDVTLAVFQRILDQPRFERLEAGIVLQAYLPDALPAMQRLQEWAAGRRARGGAPVKVRVVKGANLPMEQVDAAVHGWPEATWGSKRETDTHYKRVLDYALHPERVGNVRVGVAGQNLFDLAFAWLLAKRRGVEGSLDFEMLLGMAQGQADAVRRDVGGLLLYTPVVHPREFDVAIAYLVRRLEEGASRENFMSAVHELSGDSALFARERDRFVESFRHRADPAPPSNRTQDRTEPEDPGAGPFANTPDTDPSLAPNRGWARGILERIPASRLGEDLVTEYTVDSEHALEAVLATANAAAGPWGAMSGAERAAVLRRAGDELAARRAELLEVMASETGKTLDQGDPEVSEAIDFARYYAERAEELDAVDGAAFTPVRVTLVTPPWNFPVAIPAGSTLSALAAGSAVVIKPAPQARRCGSVMVEALWAAGVPEDVLQLAHVPEELGEQLIGDERVDRIILTGSFETAQLFRSFRPDVPLLAETSGKNAIIVTPSADLDLAVRDVVQSAFGHAGQKCSAASLVILVGSVARSRRFHDQLLDAVRSLQVGWPDDPAVRMGPIIEPASGKLLDGLTRLGPGERWVVRPRKLDATGRLWSPGVRAGVRRGSEFHRTEYFGPILGVMMAETLDEAIALQNDVDYGLTAGIHSLNRDEIVTWRDGVQAGNLYVNRGITGAIVRRQPFGGWKRSSVGPGAKAGGPNYLFGLGSWTTARSTADARPALAAAELLQAAEREGFEARALRRAFASDAAAWADEYGIAKDVSRVSAEHNLFRYLPVPVAVRLAEGGSLAQLVRVAGAGLLAAAPFSVSTAETLPASVVALLRARGVPVLVETDAAWLASLPRDAPARIRLIGAPFDTVTRATEGRPDVAVYAEPVTEAGRLEVLPFLREQAVSVTAHRFGTPTALTRDLF